jgi:hypothetical protein
MVGEKRFAKALMIVSLVVLFAAPGGKAHGNVVGLGGGSGGRWVGPGGWIRKTEIVCDDALDNDRDGLVDCDDPDCQATPACDELDCNDGIDNNHNGLADCADPYCKNNSGCVPALLSTSPADCSDIPVGAKLTLHFSMPMDATSLQKAIVVEMYNNPFGWGVVSGSLSSLKEDPTVFEFSGSLAPGIYRARLSDGIKSVDGVPLPPQDPIHFYVGSLPDSLIPSPAGDFVRPICTKLMLAHAAQYGSPLMPTDCQGDGNPNFLGSIDSTKLPPRLGVWSPAMGLTQLNDMVSNGKVLVNADAKTKCINEISQLTCKQVAPLGGPDLNDIFFGANAFGWINATTTPSCQGAFIVTPNLVPR